jgi:choline-sulfatase
VKRAIVIVLLAAAAAAGVWITTRPSASGTSDPASRANVVLVTIDTLRADRVGRGFTPAIDALAARGVAYATARATAPLTLPSHASMMTGALPPAHGVRENGVVFDRKTPTLARTFKEAGYRTAAFVGAFVLNRRFGLDEGFEIYDDAVRRDAGRAERLEAERRGGEVVDAALAWLPSAASPFFLWIHLYDPHAPYEPPVDYRSAGSGNGYDGEVAYADAQVGRLLAAIDARGLGGSTVVAVASDHGEGLGEHGERTHGMLAYDTTLRVPLVVAVPGATPRREPSPISLADLAPLLLRAAGLRDDRPAAAIYAETRYPRRAGWHALAVLADDRWKLIRSSEPELYEIAGDPSETTNVAAAHPGVVQAMSAAIARTTAGAAAPAAVDPEAAARLRALGYVSGGGASTPEDPSAPNPARMIEAWTAFEAALGLLQSGHARGAVAALRPLAARHPTAPVFVSTYAQAMKDAGDPKGATRVYRQAVEQWPADPALFLDLAVAAREAGDTAEAARAEQAALALDPNSAMAQNGLGLLHADAGRHADAAAAFERAARIDPGHASYWTNLGNARRAMHDAAGAERAYRSALEADAGFADALNGLGVLQVQAGRAAEAVPLFERALARDAALHEARLNLGIALQESGQRERAAAVYREILAMAPASATREREAAAALLRGLR